MGPSHPATHGVLRLVLELDGEMITKATPDVGYLHRGDEKIAENMQYNQFVPYTDRLDYLAPLANNVAYACAVEKLMGWELPPRGKAIRVLCCELARIQAHLLGIGAMALDLGALTVFMYTFTEREKIYNMCELICGARFTTSYTRIGGQTRDLPDSFFPHLRKFLDDFIPQLDEVDKLLTRNRIFVDRTRDVGVISKERAIAYGLSGPNLRGSGVEHDLRRKHPYLDYEKYDFEVAIGTAGDGYDRYLVRIEEMRQSAHILRQLLEKMPERADQRGRLEKHAAAEIARHDEDGGIDPPFHRRHRRARRPAGRSLFRRGESEGRAGILHPQQGRRRAASAENPLALVLQSEHSTRAAPGAQRERCRRHSRQSGLRHGRMRQMSFNSMNPKNTVWLALLAVLFFAAACNRSALSGSKLTRANYDQITTGMSKSQVETVLGSPTKVDTQDMVIFKKTTYRYEEGAKFAMITFKNDEVDDKNTNLEP